MNIEELNELRETWKGVSMTDLPVKERDEIETSISWLERGDIRTIANANIDCLSLAARFYILRN
jgi:hypothetical protein